MSFEIFISLITLVFCLVMLSFLSLKGYSPLLPVLISVIILAIVSGQSVVNTVMETFMTGTIGMVKSMLLFMAGCTMFGETMNAAGYAHSLAYFISDKLGNKHAPAVVFLATMVMALAGMNLGVTMIVYPIGMIMFSRANYSERLLAGACFGGFWTISNASPFIPSAGNTIMMNILGTGTNAGTIPGVAGSLFMFVAIIVYIEWQARHWQKKGIGFKKWDEVPSDDPEFKASLPPAWQSVLPIAAVLVFYNVLKIPSALAMMLGALCVVLMRFRTRTIPEWFKVLEHGAYQACTPTINLAVMGGVGAVVATTPFFPWVLDRIGNSSVHPYVLCLACGAVVSGIVGSASSGVSTIVPHIKPLLETYVGQGYNMGVMHRLLSIGSISIDSLPHNGSLIACCSLLHTTVRESYFPIFITTVVIPFLAGWLVELPLALLGFI